MDDSDDDGQAAPPDPAATLQAAAADAPGPNQSMADAPTPADLPALALDPAATGSASPEPNQSMPGMPTPTDVPAPVPDPIPAASAAPKPSQSVADVPAAAEPNVCIEPSGIDPATTSPEDVGSGASGTPSPDMPAASGNGVALGDGSAQGETPAADSGAQLPGTDNAAQLTDLHYDWLKRLHGKDVREASQYGGQSAADRTNNGMTGVTPDGVGYSAPGIDLGAGVSSKEQSTELDIAAGLSVMTSDGAGYSAVGTSPDSSQSTYKLVIGINPSATTKGDVNPVENAGHTIVALEDSEGKILKTLSYGPLPYRGIPCSGPSTTAYHLDKGDKYDEFEWDISKKQYDDAKLKIEDIERAPGIFSATHQCTTTSIEVAIAAGILTPPAETGVIMPLCQDPGKVSTPAGLDNALKKAGHPFREGAATDFQGSIPIR